MVVFRCLLLIFILSIGSNSYAQEKDWGLHIPNPNGVTKHTIRENKIQLFKNANYARRQLKKYKTNIDIGYIELAIGTAGLTFAGCFMDVPQYWENGRCKNRGIRRRNARYVVSAVSILFIADGTLKIRKNRKILAEIDYTLSPIHGGLIFKF